MFGIDCVTVVPKQTFFRANKYDSVGAGIQYDGA